MRPLRVLLVGYMDLTGPGMMHLYHFANELARQGHLPLVYLNGDVGTSRMMAEPPRFPLHQLRFDNGKLSPESLNLARDHRPDVIHLWTPRNPTARCGLEVKLATGAEMVIHYEDDEDYLYDFQQTDIMADLQTFVRTLVEPNFWIWKHPVVSDLANHFSHAFTAICPPYVERLTNQWRKPVHLLYPGVDLQRFHPGADGRDLRRELGLDENAQVVLYSGSLGAMHDFEHLLEAFAVLAADHPRAELVQFGRNLLEEELKLEARRLGIADRVRFLGLVAHKDVHRYLALGDVLVQCGSPNQFNEYRLPSKLPEYLAMGRPVVTFSNGIGREFTYREHVLKYYSADPPELAARLAEVLDDPDLARRLGAGGRRRAEELFSWERNTTDLAEFYRQVVDDTLPHEPRPAFQLDLSGRAAQLAYHPNGSVEVADDGQAEEYETPVVGAAGPRILVITGVDQPFDWERANGIADGSRAGRLVEGLMQAGCPVWWAVPADTVPAGMDLRCWPQLRLWSARSLLHVIRRANPALVVLCGLEPLRYHEPTIIASTVLVDLVGPPPEGRYGTLLSELVKADAFAFASAEDRAAWLPWLMIAGLGDLEHRAVLALPEQTSGLDAVIDFARAPERRRQRTPVSISS